MTAPALHLTVPYCNTVHMALRPMRDLRAAHDKWATVTSEYGKPFGEGTARFTPHPRREPDGPPRVRVTRWFDTMEEAMAAAEAWLRSEEN